MRWLRANAKTYRIDPDHIGAWGASAGGHLSALLGTSGGVKELEGEGNPDYSSRVQAVCDFFGPADFLAWFKTNPNRVSNADAPESKLMGGPLRDHLEKAKLASPITHIDKDDPPFLIVHGDKDMVVPVSQSQRFHTALQQAKVDSTLMIVNGAGHGGAGMQTPAISAAVVAFFQKHLMP
ncbi:MAG: esterase [bacterium ADurb.Bin429]|nr:MAG: esterase [bacterium ADurb.Bin429]